MVRALRSITASATMYCRARSASAVSDNGAASADGWAADAAAAAGAASPDAGAAAGEVKLDFEIVVSAEELADMFTGLGLAIGLAVANKRGKVAATLPDDFIGTKALRAGNLYYARKLVASGFNVPPWLALGGGLAVCAGAQLAGARPKTPEELAEEAREAAAAAPGAPVQA